MTRWIWGPRPFTAEPRLSCCRLNHFSLVRTSLPSTFVLHRSNALGEGSKPTVSVVCATWSAWFLGSTRHLGLATSKEAISTHPETAARNSAQNTTRLCSRCPSKLVKGLTRPHLIFDHLSNLSQISEERCISALIILERLWTDYELKHSNSTVSYESIR